MADIFISYIHEEEGVAKALKAFLNVMCPNNKAFMAADTWNVYAGEEWLERIRKELGESRVVISMMTAQSIGRPWINFEAGAAWISKILIPVCFAGMKKGDLPKPYNSIQSLDLENPEEQYYLVRSLYHHLPNKLGLHGIFPPPSYTRMDSTPRDEFQQAHFDLTLALSNFEADRHVRLRKEVPNLGPESVGKKSSQ